MTLIWTVPDQPPRTKGCAWPNPPQCPILKWLQTATSTTKLTYPIRSARSSPPCFIKNAHNLASLRSAQGRGGLQVASHSIRKTSWLCHDGESIHFQPLQSGLRFLLPEYPSPPNCHPKHCCQPCFYHLWNRRVQHAGHYCNILFHHLRVLRDCC